MWVSFFIVFWFWNKLENEKYNEIVQYASIPIIIYLIVIILIILPKINNGDYKWANLNLRNEVLVKIPEIETIVPVIYWVELRKVNINGGDLRNTVLVQGNLRQIKLIKADLRGANLKDADLTWAHLEEADLTDSTLDNAILCGARLEGTDFKNVDLLKTNLVDANLSRTKLKERTSPDLIDRYKGTNGSNGGGNYVKPEVYRGVQG